MYLNHVQLIGFLGKDPEKRQVRGNGANFTVLSVATQQSWKDSKDEWQSKTEWHRVVAFNRLGESIARIPAQGRSRPRGRPARQFEVRARERQVQKGQGCAVQRLLERSRELRAQAQPRGGRCTNNSAQRGTGSRVRRGAVLNVAHEGPPAQAGGPFRLSRIPANQNKSDHPHAELQRIRLRRSLPALGGDTAPVPPRNRCLSLGCSKSSRAGPLSDVGPVCYWAWGESDHAGGRHL